MQINTLPTMPTHLPTSSSTFSHTPSARHYNSALSIWLSVDPMADKYPRVSPYVYCANNPVRLVDVDGRKVKPFGEEALQMIKNTLKEEDRAYVRINKRGYINKRILLSHKSNSLNYNNLKELVKAKKSIEIHLMDEFTFRNSEGELKTEKQNYYTYEQALRDCAELGLTEFMGITKDIDTKSVNGLSTGESGALGYTYFPEGNGVYSSYNDNITVFVNKKLSDIGAAETYCHEANGHVLLYLRNGGDIDGASHHFLPTNEDGNKTLVDMILSSRKETLINMKP